MLQVLVVEQTSIVRQSLVYEFRWRQCCSLPSDGTSYSLPPGETCCSLPSEGTSYPEKTCCSLPSEGISYSLPHEETCFSLPLEGTSYSLTPEETCYALVIAFGPKMTFFTPAILVDCSNMEWFCLKNRVARKSVACIRLCPRGQSYLHAPSTSCGTDVCDIRTSYVIHQCTNSVGDNVAPYLLMGLSTPCLMRRLAAPYLLRGLATLSRLVAPYLLMGVATPCLMRRLVSPYLLKGLATLCLLRRLVTLHVRETITISSTQNPDGIEVEETPVSIRNGLVCIVQVEEVEEKPWVYGDIKTFLKNEKLEQVVAIINSCSLNAFGDLKVTVKYLSGTLPGSIHYKVIKEESFGKEITVESAIILANVSWCRWECNVKEEEIAKLVEEEEMADLELHICGNVIDQEDLYKFDEEALDLVLEEEARESMAHEERLEKCRQQEEEDAEPKRQL
nr:hypothetical protein [Tanacetum cinerariifolium]